MIKKKDKYHLVTQKNNQINKSYSEQLCNGTISFYSLHPSTSKVWSMVTFQAQWKLSRHMQEDDLEWRL